MRVTMKGKFQFSKRLRRLIARRDTILAIDTLTLADCDELTRIAEKIESSAEHAFYERYLMNKLRAMFVTDLGVQRLQPSYRWLDNYGAGAGVFMEKPVYPPPADAKNVDRITQHIKTRLEYLRGEIEAERISYEEIHELQSLAPHIDPSATLLLEWAGVPEFPEETKSNQNV